MIEILKRFHITEHFLPEFAVQFLYFVQYTTNTTIDDSIKPGYMLPNYSPKEKVVMGVVQEEGQSAMGLVLMTDLRTGLRINLRKRFADYFLYFAIPCYKDLCMLNGV